MVEKQQNKTVKLPKNVYQTGPKSLMDGKRRQVQRFLKSSVMMAWLKHDSQDKEAHLDDVEPRLDQLRTCVRE